MRKLNRIQTILLGIVLGIGLVVAYGALVNVVLYPLLIPDACYFHNHSPSFLVNLLFDFPSYEGNHPVPAKLGYAFSFGLGIGLSFLFKKSKEGT